MRLIGQKISAEIFNNHHPIGTVVKYYPISGEDAFIESKTRSPAWTLGCGNPVVAIEGRSGGVCLTHLEIVLENRVA